MTTSPCKVCSSVREILFFTCTIHCFFQRTIFPPLSLFLRLVPSLMNISFVDVILLQGCTYRRGVGTFSHFFGCPRHFYTFPPLLYNLWTVDMRAKRNQLVSQLCIYAFFILREN